MTPSGVDAQIVGEWIRRAEDDALNARSILKHRDGTPAHVCFLSQQIVEKMLKAALVYFTGDDAEKTHALRRLSRLLAGHVPALAAEDTMLDRLSEYYVGARYPSDLPLESFTWERAIEAFAAAEAITAVVRSALKLGEDERG